MSGTVEAFAVKVPPPCRASDCERHGCSVDLRGCSRKRAIVDMDCLAIPLPPEQQRCDYLVVGENEGTTWVVPIELKSGGIGNVNEVLRQLEGGALTADNWLPGECDFDFLPVVAHGKDMPRRAWNRLRRLKVRLRDKERSPGIIRCGGLLLDLLAAEPGSGG